MSAEIWYTVGPKDVFPETFAPFLLGHPAVREVFMKHHAELLDPGFWNSNRERIAAGYVHDVFPYEREKRFARRQHAARATVAEAAE
jgi:isocitrate dehydrogenase kinase/phosphatase